MLFSPFRVCGGLLAAAWMVASPAIAATAGVRDTSGSWAFGLAGQVDENSSDSVLATINWGVTPTEVAPFF